MENIKRREKNKFTNKNKLIISGILLAFSGILFAMARYIAGFSNIYYKYIYTIIVNILTRGFSILPFSVYEIMLYSFIIFILLRIVINFYLILRKKQSIKKVLMKSVTNFLLYISIFAFLNIITLGLNSFRSDFVSLTGLNIKKSSKEDLTVLCDNIKDKLNELDGKINKDENGLLKLDDNAKQEGVDSMNNLANTYLCLQGFYPRPKSYIISKVMSYQLLEGETNFTLEANYNNDMPQSDIPSTICHELSHVRGFISEDEANYISFLACINSKNYEYQYSGYLMAYTYCMNDLYGFDLEAFKKINSELSDNVKKEIKNDILFWDKYKGGISDTYDDVYDKILKAGGQEEGIRSYNAVVKLLVSGYGIQF